MNIYLLTREIIAKWDEVSSFVVRARTPDEARFLAADEHGDEGIDTWLSPKKSKVEKIGTANSKKPGIVLCDFRNG